MISDARRRRRSLRHLGRDLGSRARADSLDWLDRLRGRADPLTAPRRLRSVGGGDFEATGDEFFALFRRAGLEPSDDVLDVGCGVGRMARPLAGWLRGSYDGFDVVEKGIRWCDRSFGSRHPNFRFTHLDVANDVYNPGGRIPGSELRFPYGDRSFDFAILASVFTHLLPADLTRYLSELGRVMRPRGIVFATYLLLDDHALAALDAGEALFRFAHRRNDPELGELRLEDGERPSAAVAYRRSAIEEVHQRNGLAVREVWPGSWAGHPATATFQDVTVSVAG